MVDKIEQLIKEIYTLKTTNKEKEQDLATLKADIEQRNAEIEKLSEELLIEFKQSEFDSWSVNGLVGKKFVKENVGYTSEADIIKLLKEKYQGNYLRTKLTESIDKNSLKKALKTNKELADELGEMTLKTLIEYVVVTDVENYNLMLEHINEQHS